MKLYYWDLPFRCIYIELFCHLKAINYERIDSQSVVEKRISMVENPDFSGFAPPFIELEGKSYSQMPAIMMHLNSKYPLIETNAESSYFCLKTLLDITDFMAEITRHNGAKMWDQQSWETFEKDRLKKWLKLFECQAKNRKGIFLLADTPSLADIGYVGCFHLLMHSFDYFDKLIRDNYPEINEIINKMLEKPVIVDCFEKQWRQYDNLYCGGQIEKSIRAQIERSSS